MWRMWLYILAFFRLSNFAICQMSKGTLSDFHDYSDSVEGQPFHFTELVCKRCGKRFYI